MPSLTHSLLNRPSAGLVLALCLAVYCFGQSTGGVRGTVKISGSGSPLPGAVVRLAPKRAGPRFQSKTDKQGRFRVADVAPGVYRVTVECDGFEPAVVPAVDVNGREEVTIDVPLTPRS